MSEHGEGHDLFWSVVEAHLAAGTLVRGTIMGRPCVRAPNDEFVAVPHSKTGRLIVRLPPARVEALTAAGEGEPWGPGGRVFKGWLAVKGRDRARWHAIIDEAREAAS